MNLDIPNKYIYDASFAVVVFPLFGASKDLIRDSQRLYFCNFVRL